MHFRSLQHFLEILKLKKKSEKQELTGSTIQPKASAQLGRLAGGPCSRHRVAAPTGGDRALPPRWRPPGRRDLYSHNWGAMGRRPSKVTAVGAHLLVLPPVRGGDAVARTTFGRRWQGFSGPHKRRRGPGAPERQGE
jgi:hypothetical protein